MENMKRYQLEMSDVCRAAFEAYYGSGIEFYEDEEGELWYSYPHSNTLYCIGTMAAVEEMLLSMGGGYGSDITI